MLARRSVPRLASALFITLSLSMGASGIANAAESNANILRMATGTHSFYEEDGETLRGEEYFRMIAHGDGSRTMMVTKNMFSNDRQHNITMRVDPAFRPIESFSSYWYPSGFKGSVRVTVDGETLHATSWGPVGRTEHEVLVPHALAIVTHGEGLNAWSASVQDPVDTQPGVSGRDMPRTSYFISPVKEGDGPVLGKLTPATLTRVGEETITVPAGTFETIHYSTGALEIWAMKGDRVLVQQTFRGETYVLTEYNAQ
jgi:hypothetical protein